MKKLLVMSLMLVGCGMDNYPEDNDLTEASCWTIDGYNYVYSHIPEGVVPDDEFKDHCRRLGKPVVDSDSPEPEPQDTY